MTRARKTEIRREAYAYAARELDAIRDWETSERHYPDEDEREEFETQVSRIVADLKKKAQPAPTTPAPAAG
ncbi:hypothetical protein AB0L80_07575 [Streptomyces sp. NPDC052069]|uniref:hypothetical protein n=1 Tax=Streptomyces TaxID=1883 RepID=UPI003436DB61|nr:hypothetical protein OG882_05090 [Streptomyces anulatus]